MDRLTETAWRNLDPWECCGQDKYCQRGCHDAGGCTKGCVVPKNYVRLAKYEDTGLTPEQVVEMQAENARLTKEMDRAKHKVADLFEKSDELVEEQSAFIDELQAQLRVAEKVCYAAHMYVKNSNSPLCTGWDMLLDALQKWVDGKRGPQGGEGGVHSAEASP